MKSLKWSNKRPRSNENSEDIDIISLLSSMAKEKMSHGSFESNNLYILFENLTPPQKIKVKLKINIFFITLRQLPA